jgi:predicted dinucleotide-binding enzyme
MATSEARCAAVWSVPATMFDGRQRSGPGEGQPGGRQQLTTFVAGDNAHAKTQVVQMGRDIGFDVVAAGPLQNARLLEPIGFFHIQIGYVLGLGTQIGLKLVRA